ncbi:MAG TPA: phosphoribosylaminoimidazolesuccinocarboxamide synthase [Acidobacteriota bacterium]|nr:phosphoribosylaminoimidazolesuccinocarboxamide synthase [Acidobacteriota bacterium]
MEPEGLTTLELPGIKKVNSGKVREMFEVGEHLLMVATDRISAFDVILPDAIPYKGKVLTQISRFWFDRIAREGIVPHHLVTAETRKFPSILSPFREHLEGRSMLVRRCRPLPIECVVRGYMAGSGWKEYQESGTICGISLPAGLRESDELPQPIFTPATKANTGHDENITFERTAEIVGRDTAERVRDLSLRIYQWARDYARERGIIICDTKFEFGTADSELLLIDEVLTPDSSRFWPATEYRPGRSQPSFDKQFIRDYLETLDWDKTPPGPKLPPHIIQATTERYLEAYRRLTGEELIR